MRRRATRSHAATRVPPQSHALAGAACAQAQHCARLSLLRAPASPQAPLTPPALLQRAMRVVSSHLESAQVGRNERLRRHSSHIQLVSSSRRVRSGCRSTASFVEVFVSALGGDGGQLARAEQAEGGAHRDASEAAAAKARSGDWECGGGVEAAPRRVAEQARIDQQRADDTRGVT